MGRLMQCILNADDFGRTETVNEAIVYGFQRGYISRTTVMVNMPCYDEAKALARAHGFYDKIGLHINFISGMPLTEGIKACPNFTADTGRFNGMFFGKKRLWFFLSRKERRALGEEIRAQIERYLADGFTLLHADSHGHTHTFPAVNRLVLKLLKDYGFKSVRISKNLGLTFGKKLYKAIVNRENRRFNRRGSTPVRHFGSCHDVLAYGESVVGTCEVMLHPNRYNGVLLAEDGVSFETICDFIRVRGGTVCQSV